MSVTSIIGANAGLRPVLERVEMVAGRDMPVLLFGETGTGKELIARAIHDRSPRARLPFLRVNCGAISPELIDSELFGHERGSFTNAIATRKGWFEQAHGGTLFLDEIAELTPAVQVRLLRVIQEGELVRVGGATTITVDVRIVAATHRDLAAMVEAREFREDLYYRVAGFPIVLPPLRERGRDIPELARHFAQRASDRFGVRLTPLTAGDLARLAHYDWPGNVRELAAVMDRAVLLGDGKHIDVERALGGAPAPRMKPPATATTGDDIEPLDTIIKRHIEHALARCHGRIDGKFGVARKLGVNGHTLRSRMKKLGIDWRAFK